jgi:uncharacterized protein (TIGR02391 family)
MARQRVPMPPQPARLSMEQIRAAIPPLERRLNELKALNIDTLTDADYSVILGDLVRRIDDTLISIYDASTIDYRRYAIGHLDDTPAIMGQGRIPVSARKPGIRSAVTRAAGKLQSAITVLKERIEESGETAAARALTAYRGLALHPEIARAASQLYHDGHYSTAVEHAVKALNDLVRLRSKLELDGMPLMQRALSPNNPIIKFNDLANQSDKDEQTGFMMMFGGAVAGLRNPRAHGFIHDDPERALEFIAFVSLLAKLLDEAK